MNGKIGFIGVGNMATAIIGGILRSRIAQSCDLTVYDHLAEKCEVMREKGCTVAENVCAVAKQCQIVFLAVKPQNYPEVLAELHGAVTEETVLVSLAAGISTAYVAEAAGCACKVVRVMPNTPLLLGIGATALCCSANVSETERETVAQMFRTSGIVEFLPEEQMNAIISVNGSSPAYFYLFAKAMLAGAKEQGIDEELALRMIAQTMIGSAKMLTESGDSPEELIRKVSSPGGTTLRALDVFGQNGLEETVKEAMLACTKRAEELGR